MSKVDSVNIGPLNIVQKLWGFEEWLVNGEDYCLKRLHLTAGFQCSYHHHEIKDETFVVESGQVYIMIEGEEKVLLEGHTQRILPGQRYCFASLIRGTRMLEVSTHHDDTDSHRESQSRGIDLFLLKKDLMARGLLR